MRFPRLRFTMRWLLVLVAVIAVGLGGWIGFRTKRQGARYQAQARFFADRVIQETRSEQTMRKLARSMAELAWSDVDRSLKYAPRLEQPGNLQGQGDPLDPGIFSRGMLPNGSGSYPADEEGARTAMEMALSSGRLAQRMLDQANTAARRTQYFAGLARKYEEAANHPLRAVEPDPPVPK